MVCWGRRGSYWNDHAKHICKALTAIRPLQCLGRNRDGSPEHPLYLKGNTELELYDGFF